MIGEKIIKIMNEITPVEKTEIDEEKNIKTAKAEDIIIMIRPLLIKYKVAIIPKQVTNFVPQGNKVLLSMKYLIIDMEDKEKDCIEVEIPGSGYDEKGRAVYAALTGAYRYAMQQVFAIPIIEENRNDNIEGNIEEKQSENQEKQQNIDEMSAQDIDNLFNFENV